MLAEPESTPYDLSFQFLGTPVRVHPMFWLTTALLGSGSLQSEGGGTALVVWVAAVFASILVHEMGHALMFRRYGSAGRVWLYWFGGLASADDLRVRGWRQVAVSMAGPAAGFLLAAAVWFSREFINWGATPMTRLMFAYLLLINIAWGIMNLLPVFPLDGGQALRGLLEVGRARDPMQTTLKVSAATGAAVAVWCLLRVVGQPAALWEAVPWWLRFGSEWTALLFGLLAYSSYNQLRMSRWDGWR